MLWHEKTAITTGRVTVRPMPPKSISGSCLARLAHRLVSENLIVPRQGNGVNMALQAPLSNPTCPDDENLDECRKRKRKAEKRKAQHERKRQRLKQQEDAIADPSQKSSIGPAVYACNNAPEQCTVILGKISGDISTCA
nr:5'-3' exoribonuclease 3-like isoform X2 [Ipomoea trifida]